MVEGTSVEEELERLARARGQRGVVDHEQRAELDFEADLFKDFARASLAGRLGVFDHAAGDGPVIAIGGFDDEQLTRGVEEEGAGADLLLGVIGR